MEPLESRPAVRRLALSPDGLIDRRSALAAGLSPDDVKRLVRQGVWLQVRRGWYTHRDHWAALDDLSMYELTIGGAGMREPHWHPVTGELGYVQSGHARMTFLDPDGSLDTYELRPGEAYYIPRAYPHHIEALGDDGIRFLIFFDQPTPGDVGYRATASAFSREVLSAAFSVPERELPAFPFTPVDPLIVERVNPRDGSDLR